jgi:hypothetical protein
MDGLRGRRKPMQMQGEGRLMQGDLKILLAISR